MVAFVRGRPITTDEPTVTVDAGLALGVHRFQLVVVTADGRRSAADVVDLTVERLTIPGPLDPVVRPPLIDTVINPTINPTITPRVTTTVSPTPATTTTTTTTTTVSPTLTTTTTRIRKPRAVAASQMPRSTPPAPPEPPTPPAQPKRKARSKRRSES
ncbi:MAG: hypothetical protein J0M28_13355 [Thauera sp.]|nr:hypothetical protein [Thauera sp.]